MKSSLSSVKVVARLRDSKNLDSSFFQLNQRQPDSLYVENKPYRFDHISCGSNDEIFENVGASAIDSLIEGYNGCIFVYGQTGTGKTYTMTGNANDNGIAQKCFIYLQKRLKNNLSILDYTLKLSYYEVYNENVIDLLSQRKQNMEIRESSFSFYIQRLTQVQVDDYSVFQRSLKRGLAKRQTKQTNMNDVSSRSHAILTIYLETAYAMENQRYVKSSKLNLVDLAGSQRQKETKTQGLRLKEGVNINKSLFTLTKVISKLSQNKEKNLIPYRQSVLTKLLKDSLGGNSKTTIIGTLSLENSYISETKMTLNFLTNAKKIINKVKVNQKMQNLQLSLKSQLSESQLKIKTLQQQITLLKSQLQTTKKQLISSQYQKDQLKILLEQEIHKNQIQSIEDLFQDQQVCNRVFVEGLNEFKQQQQDMEQMKMEQSFHREAQFTFQREPQFYQNRSLSVIMEQADSTEQSKTEQSLCHLSNPMTSKSKDLAKIEQYQQTLQNQQDTCQIVNNFDDQINKNSKQSKLSKLSKHSKISVSSKNSKRTDINSNLKLLQLENQYLHKQLTIYRRQDSVIKQYYSNFQLSLGSLDLKQAEKIMLKSFEQRAINAQMLLLQSQNKLNMVKQHLGKYRLVSALENNKIQIQNISKCSKLASQTQELNKTIEDQKIMNEQLRNQIMMKEETHSKELYKKNLCVIDLQDQLRQYGQIIEEYQKMTQDCAKDRQTQIQSKISEYVRLQNNYNEVIQDYENKIHYLMQTIKDLESSLQTDKRKQKSQIQYNEVIQDYESKISFLMQTIKNLQVQLKAGKQPFLSGDFQLNSIYSQLYLLENQICRAIIDQNRLSQQYRKFRMFIQKYIKNAAKKENQYRQYNIQLVENSIRMSRKLDLAERKNESTKRVMKKKIKRARIQTSQSSQDEEGSKFLKQNEAKKYEQKIRQLQQILNKNEEQNEELFNLIKQLQNHVQNLQRKLNQKINLDKDPVYLMKKQKKQAENNFQKKIQEKQHDYLRISILNEQYKQKIKDKQAKISLIQQELRQNKRQQEQKQKKFRDILIMMKEIVIKKDKAEQQERLVKKKCYQKLKIIQINVFGTLNFCQQTLQDFLEVQSASQNDCMILQVYLNQKFKIIRKIFDQELQKLKSNQSNQMTRKKFER